MKLAVIPARGGSKRIPNKNIKLFQGKPIIAWAIECAHASKLFDQVIVSTDSDEIKVVAKDYGATVPFMRPSMLADDLTPTVPVISHAIKEYIKSGVQVDYACCIYPCTPFLTPNDLIEGFRILIDQGWNYVYPVTEFDHPITRAMKVNDGRATFIYPDAELTRTQDLDGFYHDTGQFYWGKASAWLDQKKMHTEGGVFKVPNWRFLDIDTQDDWRRLELMFAALGKK
jgi:pseudaminic acid cytidylyltransferase